jgi:hypothetical protein
MRSARLVVFCLSLLLPVLSYAATTAFKYDPGFKAVDTSGVMEKQINDNKLYGRVAMTSELEPGWYRLTLPYRATGDWSAQFSVNLVYSDKTGGNISHWQNFSTSEAWSTLAIVFKMERKNAPILVFNRNSNMGDMQLLQVKDPAIAPVKLAPGDNWFENDGRLHGEEGRLPVGWTRYHNMNPDINGMSGSQGYGGSTQVLKLSASSDKPSCVTSIHFPFPDKGELEFSVWVKSANDAPALMTIFMLGDSYKWNVNQRFQLDSSWRQYTVRRVVPDKIQKAPFFWCRIDIVPGNEVLIGKVELRIVPAEKQAQVSLTKNIVPNPAFDLGLWGWNQYWSGAARMATATKRPEPVLVRDGKVNAVRIIDPMSLTSRTFPVETGKKYTVSAWMKNADPGKNAQCSLFMIDAKWRNKSKTFNIGDKWKRYSFSFDWDGVSRRGVAYLRIDPRDNPVLVERVQVEVGDAGDAGDFSVEPVQLGLVPGNGYANNIFNVADRNAAMKLKAVCATGVTGTVKVATSVRDAWGNEVNSREFEFDAVPEKELSFDIQPHNLRGVFHVALTAFDGKGNVLGRGEGRYAVCRDLAGMKLPDNPMAGHHSMLIFPEPYLSNIMPVLKSYVPINDFNRCFFAIQPEMVKNPAVVKNHRELFAHWDWNPAVKNIVVMGLPDAKNHPWVTEILATRGEIPPAVMEKYLEYVRLTVGNYKGVVDGWELFNEPHLWRVRSGPEQGTQTMPPEKTAAFYRAAYPLIKAIDPDIMVVGPCAGKDLSWSERFMKAGAANSFDTFSFHGYCDSPDNNDTYGRIMNFKALLERHGWNNVQIWNTEQYFSPRLPWQRQHEEEYYRHYFRDRELDAAAVMVANLIHHAAADSRVAMFGFTSTVIDGIGGDLLPFDAFGALNAMIEFLGNAGTGHPLELGSALKCFVFPNAKEGVLATVHAINEEAAGQMSAIKGVKAFDMMGNPLTGDKISVSNTPVYLRFPAGIDAKKAENMLSTASFLGFGDPFDISVAMASENAVSLIISNRLNNTASGMVKLLKFPAAWQFKNKEAKFVNIEPGQSATLEFELKDSKFKQLAPYTFEFGINTGSEYFTRTATLSVVFATHLPGIRGEGNINAWKGAQWIQLGEDHLSMSYHLEERWRSPEDLSARIACGWNKDGFGIAIIVKDDAFVFPESPIGSWQNDSVQLYFDMNKDATPDNARRGTHQSDDLSYQIALVGGKTPAAYLDKTPQGRYIGENNQTTGVDDEVKLNIIKLDSGELFYDIFLPLVTLPNIGFKAGNSFGFSLIINDNDGKGRKTGLTLAPKGSEPYKKPHEYRDLILLP